MNTSGARLTINPAWVMQGVGHIGTSRVPMFLYRNTGELVILGLALVVLAAINQMHYLDRALTAHTRQSPRIGIVAQLGRQLRNQTLRGLCDHL